MWSNCKKIFLTRSARLQLLINKTGFYVNESYHSIKYSGVLITKMRQPGKLKNSWKQTFRIFYHRSKCTIPTPTLSLSISKSRDEISLRGEGCDIPCHQVVLNILINHPQVKKFKNISNPQANLPKFDSSRSCLTASVLAFL